jgi:hypothetical protein
MKKSQMRGYLYEIFISHLLQKNGFSKCHQNALGILNGGIVSVDGEIQGRGTNHQIDFVGIYSRNIPFVFPIRLLAECKFWSKKVDKSFIRQYVGVYKDISENYISSQREDTNRFLDVPIIFSASDFDKEAVNLAWAQGINLVSHSRLPILQNMLNLINTIVESLYTHLDFNQVKLFVETFLSNEEVAMTETYIDFVNRFITHINSQPNLNIDNFTDQIEQMRESRINTFLFATNNNGSLINLVSEDEFPDELFQTNTADCMIYFDRDNTSENERVFYITLNQDNQQRKFYFQANEALLSKDFPQLSLRQRMDIKLDYFSELSIIKEINNITRIVKLRVDLETIMNNVN